MKRNEESFIPDIVDVRQATPYTCGVSCVQAILNFYGINKREDELAKQLGTTKEGTDPSQIVKGFKTYGLSAVVKQYTTLSELQINLQNRIPTMVAIQAWPEKHIRDWTKEWEEGHWVVVIGLDDRNIYFEDPSLLGFRGLLTKEQFLTRWHDYVGKKLSEDRKVVHLSIAVYPPKGKEVLKFLKTNSAINSSIQERERLKKVLSRWVDADYPEELRIVGKQLDDLIKKYKKDYPSEIFKSPSNTLYRVVLVERSLFEKIREGKPLILKDRPYSSWTYDKEAAKRFGNGHIIAKKFTRNRILFVLKKTFKDEEILLNVPVAAENVGIYRGFIGVEKEIIVKNKEGNIFQPEEIYLMRMDQHEKDYFFFKPKRKI